MKMVLLKYLEHVTKSIPNIFRILFLIYICLLSFNNENVKYLVIILLFNRTQTVNNMYLRDFNYF